MTDGGVGGIGAVPLRPAVLPQVRSCDLRLRLVGLLAIL
jgi:hypothetical protein